MDANKVVDKDQLDNNFPKIAGGLKTGGEGDYWGFISDAGKLEKSCKTSECGASTVSATNPIFINRKFSFSKGTNATKKLTG